MSYCRWSSMNWMCDVYVYEADEGFVTHVAGSRSIVPPIPKLPIWFLVRKGPLERLTARLWFYSDRLNLWTKGKIPSRKIGLAHDGESFTDDSPAACADRLSWLRDVGYNVPQYAIDELLTEALEAGGERG